MLPLARIEAVERKYKSFFEKFEDANELISDNVVSSDLVRVTDLSMRDALGAEDSLSISFKLIGIEGDYALGLTADSRMIIRFTNGDIKEIDFYYDSLGEPGCILRSSAWLYRFGLGGFETITFENIIVTGINNREIENIKLNNIAVYKQPNGREAIFHNVEITIFTGS